MIFFQFPLSFSIDFDWLERFTNKEVVRETHYDFLKNK